jgi:hypothetical protein
MLKVEHTSSFLPAFFQKRQVISVLSVIMIVLSLGVSVAFTRLHPAHAASLLKWSPDTRIIQKSSRSPATVVFKSQIIIVYVATDDTGGLWVSSSSDGITCPAVGINTNLTVLIDHQNSTVISPALAVFNDKLYMAYVSDKNYQLMIASSVDGINWSNGSRATNVYTDATPALAVYNNRLYVAFNAEGSSNSSLHIASYDGVNWSGSTPISNPSVSQYGYDGPSLAVFNNKLYVAFTSDNRNMNVLFASYDGTSWSNDLNIGEVTVATPTLTVFNNELFVTFADNGNNRRLLYTSSSDGTNWLPNTWVPEQYTIRTPAMAVFNNILYIIFLADNNSHDMLMVSGSLSS